MKFEYEPKPISWIYYTCSECTIDLNGKGPFHEKNCSLKSEGLESMTCHVSRGVLWDIGMKGSYDQSNGEEGTRGLFLKFGDLPPIMMQRVRKLVPKGTKE